ncbi:hypothetical protein H311_01859 [Anncaliia algerae PRA109]|nr:hypothetical protein H311_01859 [Anncaliia algerae PRA109]
MRLWIQILLIFKKICALEASLKRTNPISLHDDNIQPSQLLIYLNMLLKYINENKLRKKGFFIEEGDLNNFEMNGLRFTNREFKSRILQEYDFTKCFYDEMMGKFDKERVRGLTNNLTVRSKCEEIITHITITMRIYIIYSKFLNNIIDINPEDIIDYEIYEIGRIANESFCKSIQSVYNLCKETIHLIVTDSDPDSEDEILEKKIKERYKEYLKIFILRYCKRCNEFIKEHGFKSENITESIKSIMASNFERGYSFINNFYKIKHIKTSNDPYIEQMLHFSEEENNLFQYVNKFKMDLEEIIDSIDLSRISDYIFNTEIQFRHCKMFNFIVDCVQTNEELNYKSFCDLIFEEITKMQEKIYDEGEENQQFLIKYGKDQTFRMRFKYYLVHIESGLDIIFLETFFSLLFSNAKNQNLSPMQKCKVDKQNDKIVKYFPKAWTMKTIKHIIKELVEITRPYN